MTDSLTPPPNSPFTQTPKNTSQGIDLIAGGRNKKTHRTAPKSDNVYIKLLVKVSQWSVAGEREKSSGSSNRSFRPAPLSLFAVSVWEN